MTISINHHYGGCRGTVFVQVTRDILTLLWAFIRAAVGVWVGGIGCIGSLGEQQECECANEFHNRSFYKVWDSALHDSGINRRRQL